MDAYFQRINDTTKLENLPSRLKFMLMVSFVEHRSIFIRLTAFRTSWISENKAGKPKVPRAKDLQRLRKFVLKYVAIQKHSIQPLLLTFSRLPRQNEKKKPSVSQMLLGEAVAVVVGCQWAVGMYVAWVAIR